MLEQSKYFVCVVVNDQPHEADFKQKPVFNNLLHHSKIIKMFNTGFFCPIINITINRIGTFYLGSILRSRRVKYSNPSAFLFKIIQSNNIMLNRAA